MTNIQTRSFPHFGKLRNSKRNKHGKNGYWNYLWRMLKLLLIGLGGFLGAISRYLVQTLLTTRYPGTFPWGTFAVNIIGCLFIGIIYGLAERHKLLNEEMRLLLSVGFCGSFTTFSAFSAENLNLFQLGNYTTLGLYITASILLGLGAVFAGVLMGR